MSHKADISRGSMFCVPSFDEMTNLTPYFNHVIPAYAGIQTVSHSASQVEELYETGSKGTGIILNAEEGIVLTVHHVIEDEDECKVLLEGIETQILASPVKHCASIDRARLRISPQLLSDLSLKPIYRASAPAQIDQESYFWGYGTDELRMESGIVKDILGENTVTDAYAISGDSGSPVFNENGHLLGTMSRSNRSDRSVFTGNEC